MSHNVNEVRFHPFPTHSHSYYKIQSTPLTIKYLYNLSSIQGGQPTTGDVLHTIGTQTQEKKNRKKRACLRKTEDTRLKKIKVTSSSIELYNKYITARCLRPPKKTDKRLHVTTFSLNHIRALAPFIKFMIHLQATHASLVP